MEQIKTSEIEAFIKSAAANLGNGFTLSQEELDAIKQDVIKQCGSPISNTPQSQLITNEANAQPQPMTTNNNNNSNTQITSPSPNKDSGFDSGGNLDPQQTVQVNSTPAIQNQTIVTPQALELEKQKAELELKEKQLREKEAELSLKSKALDEKEAELAYKPETPQYILQQEPEDLVIESENELSLGGQSLSNVPLRTKKNLDVKLSMNDLWRSVAKRKANVYQIRYEKIGNICFDIYNGESVFERQVTPIESLTVSDQAREGHIEAMQSQIPQEPMIDAVEPITDVTQEPVNDMGLKSPEMETKLQKVIFNMIDKYFSNNATKI